MVLNSPSGICNSWRQCPWLGRLPEEAVRSHPGISCCDHLGAAWEGCRKGSSRQEMDSSPSVHQGAAGTTQHVQSRRQVLSSTCPHCCIWTLLPQTQATSICHCHPQSLCSLTPNEPHGKSEAMVYLARLKGTLLVIRLDTNVPSKGFLLKNNTKLNLSLYVTTVALCGCLTAHSLQF